MLTKSAKSDLICMNNEQILVYCAQSMQKKKKFYCRGKFDMMSENYFSNFWYPLKYNEILFYNLEDMLPNVSLYCVFSLVCKQDQTVRSPTYYDTESEGDQPCQDCGQLSFSSVSIGTNHQMLYLLSKQKLNYNST